MVPGDVEEIRILAVRTILKDIHQHQIVAAVRHVIGDDVLEPTHAVFISFRCQSRKILGTSELGIKLIGIRYVVAVRACLVCPEYRRCVDVTDAEGMQIWNEGLGIFESERRTKLKSIRGCRYAHQKPFGAVLAARPVTSYVSNVLRCTRKGRCSLVV